MLNQRILTEFLEETKKLLSEMEGIVEKLDGRVNDGFPVQLLSDFANRIDRIMGALKTFIAMDSDLAHLQPLAILAEMCKRTGYQAARLGIPEIIPLIASFWADVIDLFNKILEAAHSPEEVHKIARGIAPVLEKRLYWLAIQMTKLSGQTIDVPLSQKEIDELSNKPKR